MPKIIDHESRRAELVDASWQVIAHQGLENLTLRKVAEMAGCTTGRITHYFEDRDALVVAALRAVNDAAKARTTALLDSNLNANEKLLRALEEGLPLDKPRLMEWKVWIAFWSVAASNPALARENHARNTAWLSALAPLIKAIAPKANADHEARILMGAIDGVGLVAAISPTAGNKAKALEAIRQHVKNLASNYT